MFYGIKLIGLIDRPRRDVSSLLFSSRGSASQPTSSRHARLRLGFYLPDIVVGNRKKRRGEAIFLGLPDALDLMVVCVEAGLGLDAAMRRVTSELAHSCPVICEEFAIANFQIQMGRPRRDVLRDLGIRTGVDDVRALAAVIIQAEKFGSSIASALRVQSDAMRLRRRQLAEERAAKTSVKIMLPLIFFIFPGVFVVLVGPAVMRMAVLMATPLASPVGSERDFASESRPCTSSRFPSLTTFAPQNPDGPCCAHAQSFSWESRWPH